MSIDVGKSNGPGRMVGNHRPACGAAAGSTRPASTAAAPRSTIRPTPISRPHPAGHPGSPSPSNGVVVRIVAGGGQRHGAVRGRADGEDVRCPAGNGRTLAWTQPKDHLHVLRTVVGGALQRCRRAPAMRGAPADTLKGPCTGSRPMRTVGRPCASDEELRRKPATHQPDRQARDHARHAAGGLRGLDQPLVGTSIRMASKPQKRVSHGQPVALLLAGRLVADVVSCRRCRRLPLPGLARRRVPGRRPGRVPLGRNRHAGDRLPAGARAGRGQLTLPCRYFGAPRTFAVCEVCDPAVRR